LNQQELLDYCLEMQRRGDRYESIATFLKRQNADELTTKIIFRELDKIDKANKLTASTKLPISWGRLIAGFLLSCLGVYPLVTSLRYGRISLYLSILGTVGFAMFLGESIKLITNLNRK
jgi:hypothetical protein